jgi:hypothetical protein
LFPKCRTANHAGAAVNQEQESRWQDEPYSLHKIGPDRFISPIGLAELPELIESFPGQKVSDEIASVVSAVFRH